MYESACVRSVCLCVYDTILPGPEYLGLTLIARLVRFSR